MPLKHDWKRILLRAWSIRLMVLAAILSGLEAALPFGHNLGWLDWLPGGLFALLTFAVVAAAFVSRIVAQKNLGD